MHRRSSQLTIAAVALVLGVLVVIQLRSEAGNSGLAQLSAQDLTVLVANLNGRNDQLRRESSTLEAEFATSTRSPPTCSASGPMRASNRSPVRG